MYLFKTKSILTSIFLITLFSCQNKESRKNDPFAVKTEAYFSDKNERDLFSISLLSEDILESMVEFKIIDSSGKVLYSNTFKSQALIGYGLSHLENPTSIEKEKYILKRLNTFFSLENFILPAIAEEDVFDKDYTSLDEYQWQNLKSKGLVGFYFILWEGDQKWITFYEDIVIEYQKCC